MSAPDQFGRLAFTIAADKFAAQWEAAHPHIADVAPGTPNSPQGHPDPAEGAPGRPLGIARLALTIAADRFTTMWAADHPHIAEGGASDPTGARPTGGPDGGGE